MGARLDQLGCSGEDAALLDALSYPTIFRRIEFARGSEVSKVDWLVLFSRLCFYNRSCRSYYVFLGELAPFFGARHSHFAISKYKAYWVLIKLEAIFSGIDLEKKLPLFQRFSITYSKSKIYLRSWKKQWGPYSLLLSTLQSLKFFMNKSRLNFLRGAFLVS